MSVNIKENGDLTTVANNISITQANWNDRGNTNKNTCIKNQPATLKTLEEVSANTDENALVGANAVKELNDSLTTLLNIYNPSGRIPEKTDANQVFPNDNLKPYYINSNNGGLNLPQTSAWGILINYIVLYNSPNFVIMQVLFANDGIHTRNLTSNGWTNWIK